MANHEQQPDEAFVADAITAGQGPLVGEIVGPYEPYDPYAGIDRVTEVSYTVGSRTPIAAQARLINDAVARLQASDRHEAIKSIIAMQALAMGYQAEHGDQHDVNEVVRRTRDALTVIGNVTTGEYIAASDDLRREAH